MGPKPDKKEKKEILVGGVNLATLTDEQLLEFQKTYREKMATLEKETALLEVEVNMLRNAWKSTEDHVSDLELENVMIRRELDLARQEASKESPNKQNEFDRGVAYDRLKEKFALMEESGERVDFRAENWLDMENAEEYYESKPEDMEERYEADVRHVETNRRLKKKKEKLEEKLKKLMKIQEEVEKDVGNFEAKSHSSQLQTPSKKLAQTESSKDNVIPMVAEPELSAVDISALTISTGSLSDKSAHSVVDRLNPVDATLDKSKSVKIKPLSVREREIKHLALMEERKWRRNDPRYDDSLECDESRGTSDADHIFDDFNPVFDEDVDDSVNFFQMKKWLEFEADDLVEEMRQRTDRRMKAMTRIWRDDVKNVLCAQLKSAEAYDSNLRDISNQKMEQEERRTAKNEEILKLLIQGLEDARVEMIRERHAMNKKITEQQTEELNYLIQESYDRTINELKESNEFNFNLSQMFFVRSTENDIALVHELHSEQKRVEEHVAVLKAEVEEAKKELIDISGPLEEEEKVAKWMETAIAALQKDAKSKKEHERTNLRLSQSNAKIENDTKVLETENWGLREKLRHLKEDFEDISDVRDRLVVNNAFVQKVKRTTAENEKKIVNLKRRLKSEMGVRDADLRLIRRSVQKTVLRGKMKKWHNLVETKAFNELITQFDLRARDHRVKAFVGIDKLAIPYRKTSANVITTFDDRKKVVFPLGK